MSLLEERFVNKGRQEGKQEGMVEVVQKMLAQGFAFEVIKTCTGLSLQKIKEVAEPLKRTVASLPVGDPA